MNLFGFGKGKKKILIVEDEAAIADGLKARLSIEKFDVAIASDGVTGVEKARKLQPDLIILDVMLPDIDGFEICRILKRESATKAIPILFLTALPHIKDADQAYAVGGDDFLNKPYSNDRLIEKVKKLLKLDEKPT